LLDMIIPGERPRAAVPIQRDRYSRNEEFREREEEANWKTI
jgi:hypothetical protein